MSKIVIDARELRTSTGRYIERLLHYLQQIDDKNQYVVLLKPQDIEHWQPTNKHFEKVVCKYKEFSFGEQLGMLAQIKRLRPDLVHFGMTQQPVFYRGSSITTVHDLTTARFDNPSKNMLLFAFKQRVYRWVIKKVVRKSRVVLTPSEFVRDDLAKFTRVNSRKIVVTYEAAEVITDKPEPLDILADKKFIMYVGRPQPHKNLGRLVESFALLQRDIPDLHLVLAGRKDALYRRLERQVKQNDIKNVVFAGYVSEGCLRWLYEHARAYVFPSLSEGFGLPGLEAMVHGAPLVSSNATCLPEVYGDGALYFDPTDVNDMASAVAKVVSNTRFREKLVQRGRARSKQYSWRRMAEQTIASYQEVLADG